MFSSEFETVAKMSDSLFVVRKVPLNRHSSVTGMDTSLSSTPTKAPSSTIVGPPNRERLTSYIVRRIPALDKASRDGLVARVLQFKSRVARASHIGTSALLSPMNELSRWEKDCGGLTPSALCAASLSLLPIANAFSSEQQPPRQRSVDLLIPVAGDDSRPFGFVEWNMMQAAAGMFGSDTREIMAGSAGWLAELQLPWSEELLWRLLSALCGALAVVHNSGLDYNGAISLEEIFCRQTTPVIAGRGVPPASQIQHGSPTSSSPKKIPEGFTPVYQQPRHTKFVAKSPQAGSTVEWSTVLPHQVQFVLCLPSKLMDSSPPPVMTAEQARLVQASDIQSVGELLSFVITECVDRGIRSTLSSELTFLIRRMCSDDTSSSPRPTAIQLMQFQAVKLRVQSWISRTGFEMEKYLAEDREREYASEIDILKKSVGKLERQKKELESFQQQLQSELTVAKQVQSTRHQPTSSLEQREQHVSEREEKLSRFLSLYELTTSKLDALSLTQDSCDLFKGLLNATTASSSVNNSFRSGPIGNVIDVEDPLSLRSPQNLSQTQALPLQVAAPSTPPRQLGTSRITPQMSPLPVIHSNDVSVDEISDSRAFIRKTAAVSSTKSPEAANPQESEVVMIEMDDDEDTEFTAANVVPTLSCVTGVTRREGRSSSLDDAQSRRIGSNESIPQVVKVDPRQRSRMDNQYEQLKKMQENLHREGRSGRTPVKEEPQQQTSWRSKRSPSHTKLDTSDVDEAGLLLRQLRAGVRIT